MRNQTTTLIMLKTLQKKTKTIPLLSTLYSVDPKTFKPCHAMNLYQFSGTQNVDQTVALTKRLNETIWNLRKISQEVYHQLQKLLEYQPPRDQSVLMGGKTTRATTLDDQIMRSNIQHSTGQHATTVIASTMVTTIPIGNEQSVCLAARG